MKRHRKLLIWLGVWMAMVLAVATPGSPLFRRYQAFRLARATTALPECDRVELFHLGDRPSGYAATGFPVPISPDGYYAPILGHATLSGADAVAFASLWRSQKFGPVGLCHEPGYGMRFYSGYRLVFETTVCFGCADFYYTVFDFTPLASFDANAQEGQKLLARFQGIFPASIPKTKPKPRKRDWWRTEAKGT